MTNHETPSPTAVWVDGDPLMEAIAAAVWEQCGRSDSGSCVEDDPRTIAAVAAAVSVPPPAPRAADRRARYAAAIAEGFRAFDADTTSDAYLDAELLDAVVAVADAEEAELLAAVSVVPPATNRAALRDRIRRALCEASGNGFMWGTDMLEPDEYGDVADAVLAVLPEPEAHRNRRLRRVQPCNCEHPDCADCQRRASEPERRAYYEAHKDDPTGWGASTPCRCPCEGCKHHRAARNPAAAVSGPCVAGEQQNETPEAETGCAHCGKTIRLITGTLAEWWVHDPGGHTICVPEQAASSPRATPKPNAGVRQDGARS